MDIIAGADTFDQSIIYSFKDDAIEFISNVHIFDSNIMQFDFIFWFT